MTQTLSRETVPEAPSPKRLSLASAISDCRVLIRRNVKHIARNPEMLFQAVSLPIVLLLLFRFVFGGAINVGAMSYVDYLVPGLIIVCMAFNATTTVVGVASDLQGGIMERFRSMPMSGSAVLIGHVVSGVLRSALSTAIMIAVGLLIGFRPGGGLVDWLGALGLFALFATAISWSAVLLGTVAKTVEGAGGLGMILVFLPYATSALVPTASMPGVLQAVIDNQPVTPVVDSVRGLLNGMPIGSTGWIALAWLVGVIGLTGTLAVRRFKRAAA
jgi:ABC-2 type transport system permease protein